MPNDMLLQIVDCAHHGKIGNIDQLAKETQWSHLNEYGEEVLRLIKAHQRPQVLPPPVETEQLHPLSTALLNNQPPLSVKTTKKRVCSKCQSAEHIGTSLT